MERSSTNPAIRLVTLSAMGSLFLLLGCGSAIEGGGLASLGQSSAETSAEPTIVFQGLGIVNGTALTSEERFQIIPMESVHSRTSGLLGFSGAQNYLGVNSTSSVNFYTESALWNYLNNTLAANIGIRSKNATTFCNAELHISNFSVSSAYGNFGSYTSYGYIPASSGSVKYRQFGLVNTDQTTTSFTVTLHTSGAGCGTGTEVVALDFPESQQHLYNTLSRYPSVASNGRGNSAFEEILELHGSKLDAIDSIEVGGDAASILSQNGSSVVFSFNSGCAQETDLTLLDNKGATLATLPLQCSSGVSASTRIYTAPNDISGSPVTFSFFLPDEVDDNGCPVADAVPFYSDTYLLDGSEDSAEDWPTYINQTNEATAGAYPSNDVVIFGSADLDKDGTLSDNDAIATVTLPQEAMKINFNIFGGAASFADLYGDLCSPPDAPPVFDDWKTPGGDFQIVKPSELPTW